MHVTTCFVCCVYSFWLISTISTEGYGTGCCRATATPTLPSYKTHNFFHLTSSLSHSESCFPVFLQSSPHSRMTSKMSGSSKQGQSLNSATRLTDTHSKHSQHMRNLEVGLISNPGNSTAFRRQHLTRVTLFSLSFCSSFLNGVVATNPTGKMLITNEEKKNWHSLNLNTYAHIIILHIYIWILISI